MEGAILDGIMEHGSFEDRACETGGCEGGGGGGGREDEGGAELCSKEECA